MEKDDSNLPAHAPFIMLEDKKCSLPLHRQIYEALRRAILKGDYGAGAKLPSTRSLAAQLGVSRMTVVVAYDQLKRAFTLILKNFRIFSEWLKESQLPRLKPKKSVGRNA